MCRRPKSREETPKEGGGNARTRIAALHQYASAPHKKQGVLTYFFTIPQGARWPEIAPPRSGALHHRIAGAEIDERRGENQHRLQPEHHAIGSERIDAVDGREQVDDEPA